MIYVLSMDNSSNKTVTAFYMETIFLAASKVTKTRWFTFQSLPTLPKKNGLFIVSTVIEALKLRMMGYNAIGVWLQGILPEESYMKHSSRPRKMILEIIEKNILKNSKLLFAVSEYMIEHYERKYGFKISNKTIIMPCFNTVFNKKSFENIIRYKKNIFCYVGSLAKWQCFEDTINLFSIVEKKLPKCELRVFTPDVVAAESICRKKLKNYSIKFVNNNDLKYELQNITYGFIIRKDDEINRVATPTKLSNYVSNGVIPIFTSSLYSFSKATKNLNYICKLNSINDAQAIIDFCKRDILPKKLEDEFEFIFSDYYNRDKYIRELSTFMSRILSEMAVK